MLFVVVKISSNFKYIGHYFCFLRLINISEMIILETTLRAIKQQYTKYQILSSSAYV